MADVHHLKNLRPLGKLEQISASCHHLGLFNNVGLSAHYELPSASSSTAFDLRRLIYVATGDVVQKNHILLTIPVNEDAVDPYFASLPEIDLTRSITFIKRSKPIAAVADGTDEELDGVLTSQHNTNFKAGYGNLPFWRLIILQDGETESAFTASFIYHHAIGDGVSGLVFHKAFRNALEVASSSDFSSEFKAEKVVLPEEKTSILPPLEELHPLPISTTPQSPPVTEFRHWTGNSICTPCESCWVSLHLSPSASKGFFLECKEKGFSVTSALSSLIATILFGVLSSNTEALTCIIPVSLRPWLNLPREDANNAMGTYFDATRVQFTRPNGTTQDPSSTDVWGGAQHVSREISRYLQNVSPSGEPFTAVAPFKAIQDVSAVFKSLIGNPRDAALEVTNVGMLSLPIESSVKGSHRWQVGQVLLSRSAVASGAAVTVSVATGGDGSMTVGFSWQEGVVEKDIIGKLQGGIRDYFGKYS